MDLDFANGNSFCFDVTGTKWRRLPYLFQIHCPQFLNGQDG
jgi:hypothetical protein